MRIDNFMRFGEVIQVKAAKRVVSVTVRPTIADCTGSIFFTDLQLQEGSPVTGYTRHTETMLDGTEQPLRWYNGIIRNGAAIVIPNLGETSTPLDYHIHPLQSMDAEQIVVSQGQGAHAAVFREPVNAGDALALLATSRQCLKNGSPTAKHGFYQYAAAGDSKHPIALQTRKSARVYVEYRERKEGGERP